MGKSVMENFSGWFKVEVFYSVKYESVNAFIDDLTSPHRLQQHYPYLNRIKRNEPGPNPNSFAFNQIYNYCLNFGVHFNGSDFSFSVFHNMLMLARSGCANMANRACT